MIPAEPDHATQQGCWSNADGSSRVPSLDRTCSRLLSSGEDRLARAFSKGQQVIAPLSIGVRSKILAARTVNNANIGPAAARQSVERVGAASIFERTPIDSGAITCW